MTLHYRGQFVPGGSTSTSAPVDVTQVDSSALHDIGTEIEMWDDTVGSRARFRYHRGVASVTTGDACILKAGDNACILVDDGVAGAEIGASVGIAMAAIVAASYGWFQVWGRATVNVAASFAADGLVYATTTAGTVDDAAGGGQILKARSESAIGTPAASQAYIDLDYPFIGGTAAGLA